MFQKKLNIYYSKSLGSILDLGCGTGLVGLELKNNLSYLEGVDLSKAMIEEAKKRKYIIN